jgi:excisionase family DNA binding protein
MNVDAQSIRLAYSVPEAARRLACSPGLIYRLARTGHLRLTKLGRRTLVAAAELERVLAACTPATSDPAAGRK